MTEQLQEVRLARVYRHFTTPGYPVGIITAFRREHGYRDNVQLNYKLSHMVTQAGFGFVWVDGAWREKNATTGANGEVGHEVSLMVIGHADDNGELEKFLLKMCFISNPPQDGFLFKDKQGRCGVINNSGAVEMHFNQINMDQLSDIYTRLRSGAHGKRAEKPDQPGKTGHASSPGRAFNFSYEEKPTKHGQLPESVENLEFVFLEERTPASVILRMMGREHYFDNPAKMPDSLK